MPRLRPHTDHGPPARIARIARVARPGARRIAARAGAAVAVAVGLGLVAMPGTGAQTASGPPVLRRVDSVDPSKVLVDFLYRGAEADLPGLQLTQNGTGIPSSGPATPFKPNAAVLLVIDSGRGGMDKDGALISARDGAVKMIAASPGTMFAVVQAGDKAVLAQGFTSDASRLKSAIDKIGPTAGSSVWGALRLGGELLKQNVTLQPNIVLMVGDNDTVPGSEPVGRTAVFSSGATVFLVARTGYMDPAPYVSLVDHAGGVVSQTDQVEGSPKMDALVQSAGKTISSQQYRVAYPSGLRSGEVADLTLTINGQSSSANFLPGGVYQGGEALRPELGSTGSLIPFLDNRVFFLIALGLALVATAGVAYALTSLLVKDELSDVLSPYAEAYGADADDDGSPSLAKSPMMKRAVALTEQVADSQGYLTRAEGALERANLPLRAGEALFFYAAVVVLATLLALFYYRNLIAGIIVGVLAAILPVMWVKRKAKKRRKKFMAQLPDTLSLLSGTLRAGYSLMQGVEAVSQEVEEPMGLELRRVITESRLGRPLEESLDASAERMDSPDFGWAVMAIRIQREVGGNLAELLMTVADTMIQRERLRRDVSALTAEGRVSASVLAGLPPGLGVLMWVMNPAYINVLFSDPLGIGMLITAGISMLIGFLWMKKIITIEI